MLRASRGYVAAKKISGACGACIAYLGSHNKNPRFALLYAQSKLYISPEATASPEVGSSTIICASRGYAGNLYFLARLRRHAYSSTWAINKRNLRASRGYVGNLNLNCRFFQMFSMALVFPHARATVPVLAVRPPSSPSTVKTHRPGSGSPPPPRTVTCTGSVKTQTPIGAHVALAAVWPLLACLRVELICLPAATR